MDCHNSQCVDVGAWHGLWGRFVQPDTPVPEGFQSFDLVPVNDGGTGAPYLSQYAYATFSGDVEAMHRTEGYDSDAMCDVTRHILWAIPSESNTTMAMCRLCRSRPC